MATQTNDLRGAADTAAQQFAAALTGFLLVAAYLGVSLTQISDADFLTGRGQTLPIIGSTVPTEAFFWAAPALLLILHLGLLLQWTIYQRKVQSFVASLADQSAPDQATQIDILSPSMMTAYLLPRSQPPAVRWAAWTLTVVATIVLPLALLVGIQVRSLAFHFPTLSLFERLLVLIDLAAVWVYFPAQPTASWSTPARVVWALISVLTIAYVCLDAVVPAPDVQNLDTDCTLADFRNTCNLTDRLLRKRRLDVAGQTLRATSAPDSRDSEGSSAWLNLEGADLRFADFSHATLSHAALYGANFQGAHLVGTRFLNSTFQYSGTPKASWEHAVKESTRFAFAYAALADFSGHDLHEVDFTGSVLAGADFTGCNLLKARLEAASLDGANLQAAYLVGADLELASLIGADLRYAVLSAAILRGADLRGALLYRNPLFATVLDLADLSYASAIALGPEELAHLRKKIADVGVASTSAYKPRKMIDLLSGPGEQINLRVLLRLDGLRAWLMNFDYLPIPENLASDIGEPLATDEYVQVLQGYIRYSLQRRPELVAPLARRRVTEQLLVPTVMANQNVLLIGEPNSPPVQEVRDAMIDRLTRLEIVGVGRSNSPDLRYEPWTGGAATSRQDPIPVWLNTFIKVLADPKNSRDTDPSSLVDSLSQQFRANNMTALALAARLRQMYANKASPATRQVFVTEAERYQPDAQTWLAIAALMPIGSPTWLTLMQRASSQSGQAAAQLGATTRNEALIRQAASLGNVRAAADIGENLYMDPKSSDSIKRDAWRPLAYAAYRGEISAQEIVGMLMSQRGDYEGARRWLASAAAEGEVDFVDPYAYFLATCPDATYRDPALALRLATDEWRQTLAAERGNPKLAESEKNRRRTAVYSTLATSYAAAGDFPEAIAIERKALALLPNGIPSGERTEMESKLADFQKKRPWLEYPVE